MKEQGVRRGDDEGIWQGWGTALKPAWEPIIVARKPLDGTVAANVLEHGTGALNIDGCRVPTSDRLGGGAENETRPDQKGNEGWTRPWMSNEDSQAAHAARVRSNVEKAEALGRWPANLIHDGSEEVVATFAAFGEKGGGGQPKKRGADGERNALGKFAGGDAAPGVGPSMGNASRFFYCAKASKSDRNLGLPAGQQNKHPTVKPISLMRYLCKLVTPPGGLIADPFCGSGSTGVAAKLEGFRFYGTELDEESAATAAARIAGCSDAPSRRLAA